MSGLTKNKIGSITLHCCISIVYAVCYVIYHSAIFLYANILAYTSYFLLTYLLLCPYH